jgi:hypothetical protein
MVRLTRQRSPLGAVLLGLPHCKAALVGGFVCKFCCIEPLSVTFNLLTYAHYQYILSSFSDVSCISASGLKMYLQYFISCWYSEPKQYPEIALVKNVTDDAVTKRFLSLTKFPIVSVTSKWDASSSKECNAFDNRFQALPIFHNLFQSTCINLVYSGFVFFVTDMQEIAG